MLRDHILLAIRQLRHRPLFSFIQLAGLIIGLAAALLVSTIVINDLSYDRQWSKKDRIFRMIARNEGTGLLTAYTESGITPELKKAMPEVEDYCRMQREDIRLRLGHDEQGVALASLLAEQNVWNVLDFSVLEGNPRAMISGVENLVITESVRKRFFPNVNPVGLRVSSISTYSAGDTFVITGVVKDLPQNSHLRADVIGIRQFRESQNSIHAQGASTGLSAYIMLKPGVDLRSFTRKINAWYKQQKGKNSREELSLQPMQDIYLRTDFPAYQSVKGNYRSVYMLTGVCALLLLIVCINYINLSTAAAIKRAKATSIRKILGAGRKTLLHQFLVECAVYFLISFCAATLLFILARPALESFADCPLPLGINRQWSVFAGSIGVVAIIMLLTASYPAWALSKPAAALSFSHSSRAGAIGELFRRGLVVVQFAVTIVLLIATLVVHRQVRLLDKSPLGYNKNNLLAIDLNDWGDNARAFRNEISHIAGVESQSIARWMPAGSAASMFTEVNDPEHPDHQIQLASISADIGFSRTMGFRLLRGRWLNERYGLDAPNFDSLMSRGSNELIKVQQTQSVLITESVAKRFGVNTLGASIKGFPGIPVGVIADFKNESLKTPQGFCVVQAESRGKEGSLLIRVAPGTEARVKPVLAKVIHKYYPSLALDIQDVTDLLAAQYDSERKLMQIFYFFSGLIVFLSCMGLFGLVTFLVQSNVKEIGIRKALGASPERITAMFTWNFLRLVLLSAIVAIPSGAWLMSRWLQEYPYRAHFAWWLFALPVALAVLIATLTVATQSVRAALANPADALRTE